MRKRIIFVNLNANAMLVKTLNKFIFKQSVAIKHKYLLDYLLNNPEYEVCAFINKKAFSLASNFSPLIMRFLNLFRFIEYRIALKKNNIDVNKITLIKNPKDIKKDDIVIAYRGTASSLYMLDKIDAFKAIGMIHFWGKRDESALMKNINPDVLFNESDLTKYSEIFRKYYSWYTNGIIVHPFVYEPRFRRIKPFKERICKAFATGTITYKNNPDFLEVYKDPCNQPARKQIKDNEAELTDYVFCTSENYSENAKTVNIKQNNIFGKFYKSLHYKMFESQQKKYYSFDMVESFNNYKMCIVGEEVLGIPGIGFVEGMACGCAYIGQNIGYYEDYGMKEGVHYIGYDGSLDDLKAKIKYYQQPEHQEELERIANTGYKFALEHFNGKASAEKLLGELELRQKYWLEKYTQL